MMMLEKLKRAFEKYDILLTQDQAEKFILYYELLIEWNKKFNLTRIIDAEDMIQKHFLDSALPLFFNLIPVDATKCIDIGSGAGFPAIPLMILRDNLYCSMLDSSNKRILFLQEMIRVLKLNAEALHARAEDVAREKKFRERYDVTLSRAVAPGSVILEYSASFCKIGGRLLLYKGPAAREEFAESGNAVKKLGLSMPEYFEQHTAWGERIFVICNKIQRTPNLYPRSKAVIDKKPL